ncbi:MAG: acylphosphatase [Planctomycetota bacterium]
MSAEGETARVRCRVIYSGHVQGVFFRATAQDLSRRREVVGFVRNLRDGTVELEAEGPAAEVEAFLADIATYYSGHIRDARRTTLPPRGDERSFEIQY